VSILAMDVKLADVRHLRETSAQSHHPRVRHPLRLPFL
jgi:hypothetical protein